MSEEYIKQIKSLQVELAQLRAEKFRRFNNEDCWLYQGDGNDHLESLVCPVVIAPQTLKHLIDENQVLREAVHPRPETKGTAPLILYFADKDERDEFVELYRQVKPDARSYNV